MGPADACSTGVYGIMTLRWRAVLRLFPLWLSLGLLLTLGTGAFGQWPLAPPPDPVAAKAHAVLERHCARCHQQGRLERAKPAANFSNVLQLGDLAREGRLVLGGNPDASRLWTHMMRRLMPYDVFQERNGGTGPDADEILAVRDWIERAAPPRGKRKARPAKAAKGGGGAVDEPVLTVAADKSTYAKGDALRLRISSTADCHLTLVSVDARGLGTVIFPSELASSNALAANQELTVPAADAGYLFRVKEPGKERVIGLCNLGTGAVDDIRHDFERQRFTDLGDYRAFLAKAIAGEVAERDRGTAKPTPVPARRKRRVRSRRPAPPPEPYAAPQKVLRTGVVFEVK